MILDILNSAVEDSLYRYKQCKCLDNNVDCLQELFRQATASTARQLTISAHIIGKFKIKQINISEPLSILYYSDISKHLITTEVFKIV